LSIVQIKRLRASQSGSETESQFFRFSAKIFILSALAGEGGAKKYSLGPGHALGGPVLFNNIHPCTPEFLSGVFLSEFRLKVCKYTISLRWHDVKIVAQYIDFDNHNLHWKWVNLLQKAGV